MRITSYRFLPLYIYIAFSLFVMSCLYTAPITYNNISYISIASYVSAVIIVFSIGYKKGSRGGLLLQSSLSFFDSSIDYRLFSSVKPVVHILMLISFFYVLKQWLGAFILDDFGFDLGMLGENYLNQYEGYERGGGVIDVIYIINIFAQSALTLTMLFGIFYYREMSKITRWLFLFIIISYVLVNILMSGKQKYLGDVIIITIYYLLFNIARYRRKITIKTITLFGILVFFSFSVFVEILNQRYIAAGIGIHNIAELTNPLIEWNDNSIWFDMFGSNYGFAIGIFLGYFSNGLYGLSLCLSMPFEWTYFVGNSYSLSRVIEILFDGASIIDKTYPTRVGNEYGWGLSKWHSLFSWLASDFTFFGVIILAYYFGKLYRKIWIEALLRTNPISGPLFLYLSLGLIFSFSNNQIMHGMPGVIALIFLLITYLFYLFRKRSSTHVVS